MCVRGRERERDRERYTTFNVLHHNSTCRTVQNISVSEHPVPHSKQVLAAAKAGEIKFAWSKDGVVFGGGWVIERKTMESAHLHKACLRLANL